MKRLVCLFALIFAACDIPPAWDGNPSSCDYVIEGACVRGIPEDAVVYSLGWAREIFGPLSIDGYLIEKKAEVKCGVGVAEGCQNGATKLIQISEDATWCDEWLLTHEFGHVAINDPKHNNEAWGVLQNKEYWTICGIPYP